MEGVVLKSLKVLSLEVVKKGIVRGGPVIRASWAPKSHTRFLF